MSSNLGADRYCIGETISTSLIQQNISIIPSARTSAQHEAERSGGGGEGGGGGGGDGGVRRDGDGALPQSKAHMPELQSAPGRHQTSP